MQNAKMQNAKRGFLVFNFAFCILHCLAGLTFAGVPDGYVVRVESASVYLDWGEPSGVKPGDRFSAYTPARN